MADSIAARPAQTALKRPEMALLLPLLLPLSLSPVVPITVQVLESPPPVPRIRPPLQVLSRSLATRVLDLRCHYPYSCLLLQSLAWLRVSVNDVSVLKRQSYLTISFAENLWIHVCMTKKWTLKGAVDYVCGPIISAPVFLFIVWFRDWLH